MLDFILYIILVALSFFITSIGFVVITTLINDLIKKVLK